ncbi:MAG TPA: tetratricopeptide repeat protein [Candidatus Methylomirabilis sp.]|nr:tetratricopeptide repeat protein [Candidatus Methylomirabilis sp.]
MGKKQHKTPVDVAKKDVGNEVRRLLVGRPTITGVVWLLAIALVIGVSGGYLIFRAMGPASSVSPAGGRTGPDPIAAWRARLLQNPKDVEALLAIAHVQLDQQQLDAAGELYQQVLGLEPKNVEAITHVGSVLLGRGQVDAALAKYNEALAINPRYVHALWDKANLLQQVKKDYPGAIRVWESFIQVVGPDSQDGKTAQNFIAEARKAMGGKS